MKESGIQSIHKKQLRNTTLSSQLGTFFCKQFKLTAAYNAYKMFKLADHSQRKKEKGERRDMESVPIHTHNPSNPIRSTLLGTSLERKKKKSSSWQAIH